MLKKSGAIGTDEPGTLAVPVVPSIPADVLPGQTITAAHTNAVNKALADLWQDVQYIDSHATKQTPWTQDVDAAGFRLLNAGAVGIGTSGPAAPLEVFTTSTTAPAARIGSTQSNIDFGPFTGAASAINSQFWPLDLRTGGVSRIWIDTAGKVGVGIATPSARLHVAQDGAVTSDFSQAQMYVGAGGGNRRLAVGFDTSINVGTLQAFTFGGSLNNLALQPAGGKVGIGTTGPTAALHVVTAESPGMVSQSGSPSTSAVIGIRNAGSGYYWLAAGALAANDGYFSIYDSNAAAHRLLISPTGCIGIGATSPDTVRLNVMAAGNDVGARIGNGNCNLDIGQNVDSGYNVGINASSWGVALQSGSVTGLAVLPRAYDSAVVMRVPPAAVSDALLFASQMSIWYDEANSRLVVRARASSGVFKTGYINLT